MTFRVEREYAPEQPFAGMVEVFGYDRHLVVYYGWWCDLPTRSKAINHAERELTRLYIESRGTTEEGDA